MLGKLLANDARPDLLELAAAEHAQRKGPVSQADQPVDLQAHGLQDPPDFPVLAFRQGDGDPQVGALRSVLGLVDRRLDRAVAHALDGYALLQPVELVLGDAAVGPGAIATHQTR